MYKIYAILHNLFVVPTNLCYRLYLSQTQWPINTASLLYCLLHNDPKALLTKPTHQYHVTDPINITMTSLSKMLNFKADLVFRFVK